MGCTGSREATAGEQCQARFGRDPSLLELGFGVEDSGFEFGVEDSGFELGVEDSGFEVRG